MAAEASECLHVLVARGYEDLSFWLRDLQERKVINKEKRQSLRTRLRKGESEEVLLETCELILEQCKIPDEFTSKDLDVEDPRFGDLIRKLVSDGKLKSTITWMIKSWEEMEKSDAIRCEASKYCSNLDENEWVLDFIHHMFSTENDSIQETFVGKAKDILGIGIAAESTADNINQDVTDVDPMEVDEDQSTANEYESEIYDDDQNPFGKLDSDGENYEKSPSRAATPTCANDGTTPSDFDSWVIPEPTQYGASEHLPPRDEEESAADAEMSFNVLDPVTMDDYPASTFSSIASGRNIYEARRSPINEAKHTSSFDGQTKSPPQAGQESKDHDHVLQSDDIETLADDVHEAEIYPPIPSPFSSIASEGNMHHGRDGKGDRTPCTNQPDKTTSFERQTPLPHVQGETEIYDSQQRTDVEMLSDSSLSSRGKDDHRDKADEDPNNPQAEQVDTKTSSAGLVQSTEPLPDKNRETDSQQQSETPPKPVPRRRKFRGHTSLSATVESSKNDISMGHQMSLPHTHTSKSFKPDGNLSQTIPATSQLIPGHQLPLTSDANMSEHMSKPKPQAPERKKPPKPSQDTNDTALPAGKSYSSKENTRLQPSPRQKTSMKSESLAVKLKTPVTRPDICNTRSYSDVLRKHHKLKDMTTHPDTRPKQSATAPDAQSQDPANMTRKSTSKDGEDEDEYFDAPSAPLVVTAPKSDDSLEVRVVFSSSHYDQRHLTMYIAESYWHNWAPVRMTFDSERGFYHISLPQKIEDYKFQYKYQIRIAGVGDYWEYLPGHSKGFVNRIASVKKDTRFLHDVFVCVWDAQSATDLITRYAHLHLPTTKTYEINSITLQNQEIESCVAQFKKGWETTADRYYYIDISDQCVEEIAKNWVAKLFETAKTQSGHLLRILASLHFLCSLHSTQHHMDKIDTLSFIFVGLDISALDDSNFAQLRKLLEQVYLNDNRVRLADIFLNLYRKIHDLLKPSSSSTFQWMMTLPLYWMIVHHGVDHTRLLMSRHIGGLLHQRSMLPTGDKLHWHKFIKDCKTFGLQRNLLSVSEAILDYAKRFPWIVDTFLYFINRTTLVYILKDEANQEISSHFPLDSVVDIFFKRGITYEKSKVLLEALPTEKFFMNQFADISQGNIRCTLRGIKGVLDSAKNILTMLTTVAIDNVSSRIENTLKMILFIMRIANGAAEQIFSMTDARDVEWTVNNLRTIWRNVSRIMTNWLTYDRMEIQFTNELLQLHWSHSKFTEDFTRYVVTDIEKILKRAWGQNKKKFCKAYLESWKQMHLEDCLNECLERYALDCIESLLHERSWSTTLGGWIWGTSAKDFLIKIITRRYNKIINMPDVTQYHSRMDSVHFITRWPFASRIFQALCNDRSLAGSGDSNISDVQKIIVSFRNAMSVFSCGALTVSESRFIIENEKRVSEFYDAIKEGSDVDKVGMNLSRTMQVAKKALASISSVSSSLKLFQSFCVSIDSDGVAIDSNELKELPVLSDITLKEIVNYQSKDLIEVMESDVLSKEAMRELQLMESVSKGKIFEEVWNFGVAELRAQWSEHDELSWRNVLNDLWIEIVKGRMASLADDVFSGSLQVSTLPQLFVPDCDKKEIYDELEILAKVSSEPASATDCIPLRGNQIYQYFRLAAGEKIAQNILKLKRRVGLINDFASIDSSAVLREDTLLESIQITDHDDEINELLTNKELSNVLQKFVSQKRLLKWVSTNMKDLGEVKTFCDLGMISAGESSIEVNKISCFLSAVTGFAPLIYNLKKSANLREVVEAITAVKKNCDADRNLLSKWHDTGTHLERLKEIGQLHGSEGAQSLTQAQRINECGVYSICKPTDTKPTVDTCLQLCLKTKTGIKRYSYADLKNLQSKLMLIAGDAEQGQRDVAKFNDAMNSVANLAEVFVNLLNSGCMLFNTWSATIMCHSKGFVITLRFHENVETISLQSTSKDLEQLIVAMNEALGSWIEYINDMQLKHYHLNDYSIMQISYLCQKLAKTDFTDQVFSLLSDLPKDDIESYFREIIEEATEIVENEDFEDIQDNANEEQETKLDAKKWIVRNLVRQGHDENVAKAAAQCEENNLDITDCEIWILDHQHDSELISDLVEDFDEDSGFGQGAGASDSPVSILHNRTQSTLTELISQILSIVNCKENVGIGSIVRAICKSYNDKTSRLTLKDFLSIDHLGNFLRILRSKLAAKNQRVQRDIGALREKGKANLILIPTQDMFLATVALYMENKEEPLPSASEVLVCTVKTTTDEAGRFLRRAMCKNSIADRRLYVMTCADQLTFTVSEYIERLFNELSATDHLDPDYQLIILSSSAQPQHYLVTCFERSRVEAKITFDLSELSEYICGKLKAKTSAIPANHVASAKLVLSNRSGVGKSLHIRRLIEEMDETTNITILRLLEREIDVDHMMKSLYRKSDTRNENPHLIHIDITSAVQNGLEEFAFNLFILRSIQDSHGCIWRHHSQHFYAIEMNKSKMLQEHSVLNLLPRTECLAPKQVLEHYQKNTNQKTPIDYILMDEKEFKSDVFQRPYQYLQKYANNSDLDKFTYTHPQDNKRECLEVLLDHCGMMNPTWAQLKYFSTFLNIQLVNCEESIFCKKIQGVGKNDAIEFKGLKAFSVYFMIKMAQDFTTPSLEISDESTKDVDDALENHAIRRKWEDQVHPFVFFNEDRCTMTFINVNVNNNGDLLNADGTVKKKNMVSRFLLRDLIQQKVPIGKSFDSFNRNEKLSVLCQFMNISQTFDPDVTYELTTDNVLKMLALYMRLRCQIPVIVMGETGCGKTRMVEFMSKLKQGQRKTCVSNMVTLKVHGGITSADIYANVEKAIQIAKENGKGDTANLTTTLFFDEANTTRAIYAIKEAVCDMTIDGKDFKDSNLQIVAACNPYKKLSEAAVKKLEESGLGYNIKASETEHLGGVPMRRLVYRVVALPPSLQPFVWDFGQLGKNAEEIYIRQMTNHMVEQLKLSKSESDLINLVLFNAQCHMRDKCQDECRYVSLRDVERCLKTFEWFYQHKDHIFNLIKAHHEEQKRRYPEHHMLMNLPQTLRCLIHTIGICYHASLDDRESFRARISEVLRDHSCEFALSPSQINLEIVACQTSFTENLKMDDDIACNEALRENVFLMTVCTDLRIPLFLVGKPGSSKSLAKTILSDNMQGNSSHSELYKNFKEVHIVSYQCSAHTDAAGIETIFNQCSQLQANQNIESYAAVVVLDEIGLAEDSPNMPLKVLHPLLECGSTENGTVTELDIRNLTESDVKKVTGLEIKNMTELDMETLTESHIKELKELVTKKRKVAFIGISNWALDPAKMNRGIFVTRGKLEKNDLFNTAKTIFRNRKNLHGSEILSLTTAYMDVYKNQSREYFGLRDYYSLIKMLHASSGNGKLDNGTIQRAIQRNFSGKDGKEIDMFYRALKFQIPALCIPVQDMVQENLQDDRSRFLLLLANQYSSFSLLQNFIPDFNKSVQVIFGSSFPNDHSYTEMCRNINRVKVCMEQGRTVVLLNLTDINESLYDALNQHYVTFGGERYVDVALGGHRVKCKVATGFRLIVIELKEKVYNEYPIPLINRLEKHHLTSESLLSHKQKTISEDINEWINKFSQIQISNSQFTVPDAFLGHNNDSVSSVIISNPEENENYIKHVLLRSATMDAVFRLPKSELGGEGYSLLNVYVNHQFHGNLGGFLKDRLKINLGSESKLLEITTFSHILSDSDRQELEKQLGTGKNSVMLLSLPQFQTEQEYLKKLDDFFNFSGKKTGKGEHPVNVLLVQCPQAHRYVQLIACARYGLKNKLCHIDFKNRVVVAMLLSTERGLTKTRQGSEEKVLSLQHNSDCEIIYIDELRSTNRSVRKTGQLHDNSITNILQNGLDGFSTSEDTEQVIDLSTLIKDCVCEAMTKVKNTGHDGQRNLDRVRLLSQLCSADSRIGREFLQVLTKKMIEISQQRDGDDTITHINWVETEACSPEKLQEGGTFSKTLWLRLRRHVSLLIAYIVSIIDREDNLDLVTKDNDVNEPIHEIWLCLFSECKVSWKKIKGSNEFTIPTKKLPILSIPGNGVRMPFGFYVKELFAKFWGISKSFNLCRSMFKYNVKMRSTLDNPIFQSPEYMVAFAKEILVTDLYTHLNTTEHLAKILVKITEEVSQSRKADTNILLLMYISMKTHEREIMVLDAAMQLHERCSDILDEQVKKSNTRDTHKIYRDAVTFLLAEGSKKALEIKDSTSCAEWMEFINKLHPIFNRAIDLIDEAPEKEILMKKWQPIAILDMLLVHLLPDPSEKQKFKNYISVISTQAKLLFKGASRSAINGQQFIRIVCNILRKYLEDIRLKIILSWGNKMCISCRKDCNRPIVLPCGHYFCCDCLEKHLSAAQSPKKCVSCSLTLPDDFNVKPTELTSEQTREVTEFRRSCTSLFLEYLSQFVFREQDDEMKSQDDGTCLINLIFKELIIQKRTEGKKPEFETFGLDLNQATCSSIISTLWKSDENRTEEVINDILENDNIKEVFVAVLLHHERINKEQEYKDAEICLQDSINQLKHFIEFTEEGGEYMTVKYISTLAAVRCALTNFVKIITDEGNHKQDRAIQAARNSMISNIKLAIAKGKDESLTEFVVKVGCRMYGLSWFTDTMVKDQQLKALIPAKLQQEQQPKVLDIFTSLSPIYHELRSNLQKTHLASHAEAVGMWLDASIDSPLNMDSIMKLLAITMWLTDNKSCYGIYKQHFDSMPQDLKTAFDTMIQVVENLWPLIMRLGNGSEQHLFTMKQLVLMICTVIHLDTPLMSNLKVLMLDPSQIADKFWPAMPESFYFSLPESIRLENGQDAMYQCPNGHYYTIRNCTRPVTQSKCPDCGAIIGGIQYKSAEGNERVKKLDQSSQAGYMLNMNDKNLEQPQDRISQQASSVIQLLIHVCMLHGFQRNPASAIRILGNQNDYAAYLMKQIDGNVTEFAKAIGRNKDEGVLIIFNTVIKMMKDQATQQIPAEIASWDTLQSRKEWEKQFRQVYLLPVFQNLDQILQNAHKNLNSAEDMTTINLFRLVYEIDANDQPGVTFPLWDYYQHPTVQHLMQCIRDGASLQKGSILRIILETPQIEDLNYLEAVIKLQREMVAKYQNQLDLKESEKIKIEDLLNEKPQLGALLDKYMEAWTKMKSKLLQIGEQDDQMKTWFGKDLRMTSPISSLLPSTRGRGKCAKLLAEHITAKHNAFLQSSFQVAKINASERTTEANLLASNHFIKIDTRKQLLPMIYLHTSHHMIEDDSGTHQHITYNLDALEKQARKQFLGNAKLILQQSLPCIKYPQDIGIGNDWNKVQHKTRKQEPLPARLVQAVDERVNNATSAEVCEGVRTLTYAISFLAKVECDPDRQILDYLESDLLLPKSRTAVIPRIAKIHHVLALYQHLTWRKAVGFVQQGLQPYKEALSQINEEKIVKDKTLRSIEKAFKHMNVELFQQRVNEMLIKIPDFDEEWSLVDDIFPYLDLLFVSKEEEENAWFNKLPSDITFKQVSHLFELSVIHEQRKNS